MIKFYIEDIKYDIITKIESIIVRYDNQTANEIENKYNDLLYKCNRDFFNGDIDEQIFLNLLNNFYKQIRNM